MSFHFGKWTGPLFAGLVLCLPRLMQAQSADSGQQIIYSTPDGKSVPNAPVPAAQAPQPQEPNLSAQSPFSDFHSDMPDTTYPPPAAAPVPRSNMRNPSDERKRLRLATPAEILHVPTMEQMFGLPERNSAPNTTGAQTNLFSSQNQTTTNIISSGESSSSLESSWEKIFTSNTGANASTNEGVVDSGTSNSPSGILSEIFSSPREKKDNSIFDDLGKNPDATTFGSSQQPNLNSFLARPTAPANAGYSSSSSAFNTGPNSQSPFEVPRSSTLQTLPRLPAAPAVSGQNNYNSTPQSPPSWAPKPPPWISPTPKLGTMPQRTFN